MSLVIATLIILILSLCVSYIFKKKFEYTLPATMAGVSLILYVFSYFGIRQIGILLIVLICAFLILKSIHVKIALRRRFYEYIASAGLFYFMIIAVVVSLLVIGFRFSSTSNWDEYSHWALVLKNLFASTDFGNLAGSTTLFKYYPQGVSLFESFATSFTGHFSEPSVMGALLVLSYSQLITVFAGIRHSDWKKILILSGIMFITPLVFFDTFLDSMQVDAVMALIFANILLFSFSYRKRDVFYAIYVSLQVYLLVNTKQIGIVLAGIALSTILIDTILSLRARKLQFSRNLLINLSLPVLTGAVTYISWKFYVQNHGIEVGFSNPSLGAILHIFSNNAPYYYNTTYVNFVHHFFAIKQYGVISMSFFLWSLLTAIVVYIAKKSKQLHQQSDKVIPYLIVILGLLPYMLVLLLMYLTGFTEYESTNVASFERYLGTYFLAILAITIVLVAQYLIGAKNRNIFRSENIGLASMLFALLCVTPMPYLIDNTLLLQYSNAARRTSRAPYDNVERYKSILDRQKDSVFIISQNNNGLDFFLLKYTLTPIKSQAAPPKVRNAWSLGKPYSPEDQWSIDLGREQWETMLQNFTYVYLFKIDSQFIDGYGSLFENTDKITNDTMYRINKTGQNIVLTQVIMPQNNQ